MICSLNDVDVIHSAGSAFMVHEDIDLGFVIFGSGQHCVTNCATVGRLYV